MPKVRASSGMIGTKRLPSSGSFKSSFSSRTNAIVVATACLPGAALEDVEGLRRRLRSGVERTTRLGSEPPSAARRSRM